jgi:hypothetical protein
MLITLLNLWYKLNYYAESLKKLARIKSDSNQIFRQDNTAGKYQSLNALEITQAKLVKLARFPWWSTIHALESILLVPVSIRYPLIWTIVMVSQFSVVTVKMAVENVFSYFIKRSIIYECSVAVSKLPGLGFYQGSTYSKEMIAKAIGNETEEPKKEAPKQSKLGTSPGARILDKITQNPIGLEDDFMGMIFEKAAKRRKILRPKDVPEEKEESSSEKKEEPSVGEVSQIQEVSPKLDEAKLEADSARKLAKFMDNVIDNVKVQFEKKLSKKERRTVNYANATSYSEDDSAFAGKEEWDQRKRQMDSSWENDFALTYGGWLDDDEGRRPLPESRNAPTKNVRFEAALSKDAVLPEIQEQQIQAVEESGYAARLGKMKVSLFHVITDAGTKYNSTSMGFVRSANSRDPFVYSLCSVGKSLPMLAPKPGRYELFFIDQNGNKRKGEGEVTSDGYLQHTLDTHNGDCGRPIFALVGRTYKAIALHAFTANDHNWGYIFSSELLTTVSSKDSNLEDRRSKVVPADPSKNDRARHEGGGRGRGDRWSKRW